MMGHGVAEANEIAKHTAKGRFKHPLQRLKCPVASQSS